MLFTNSLLAQTYDGEIVMSGGTGGVQSYIPI